ncbi:MAG: hypothetical protein Kapaf2KO_04720 [Candidatus Kapaibacteriales bacterium]
MKVSKAAYFLLIAFCLFSCDDDDNSASPLDDIPASDIRTFDADWVEGTKYFDESEVSEFVGHDEDNSILVFSGSSTMVKDLEVGDVIVVHGLVLAKAKQVTESGGNVVVNYQPAKLTEAISNGNIKWNVTTDFTKAEEITVIIPDKGSEVLKVEPGVSDVTYKGKFGDYTYTINLGLGQDELDVRFDIKKKFGEYTSATFSTEGRVKKDSFGELNSDFG